MVLIPAGSFEMSDRLGNMDNALPVHTSELDAFYIGIYEVMVFFPIVLNATVVYGSNPQHDCLPAVFFPAT